MSASAVGVGRRFWFRLSKDAIWMAALFVVAFGMRLIPVLNGAGVLGIGHYDDGVHYAAALSLVTTGRCRTATSCSCNRPAS